MKNKIINAVTHARETRKRKYRKKIYKEPKF